MFFFSSFLLELISKSYMYIALCIFNKLKVGQCDLSNRKNAAEGEDLKS